MGLLHLWFGLLSALIIVLVCLSGCIYAFKTQITDLMNSDIVYVQEKMEARKTPQEIQNILLNEEKILSSIVIPIEKDRSYVVSYSKNNTDFTGYFNPYTGDDLGMPAVSTNRFFEIILDLHRNLLLGNIGRQINGAGILMFCVLLFSGFVLWIPKRVKHLKQALTIKFSGKFQRLNYDLHNTLGFYAALLLLFMAITGLYITYPWAKNAMIVSLGGESIGNKGFSNSKDEDAFGNIFKDMLNRQEEKTQLKDEEAVSLEKIMSSTDRILAYHAATTIELPTNDNPRFVVTKINTGNLLGAMLPDQITFDKTGNFKSKELFRDKPLDKQFTSLAKPLHTGEILGLKSMIIYFIICFIGLSLPMTGFIFWFNKLKKAR